MGLRITTWNVNGIRNPFGYQPWRDRRTFEGMFDVLEADIIVLQETKIQRKDLRDDMVLVPGFDCYWSLPKHKKGYSGVVIYTRNSICAPIRAEEGITGFLTLPNTSTSFRDLPDEEQIGGYPNAGQLGRSESDAMTLDSEGRCVILEFPGLVLIGTYCPAERDETRTHFRTGYLQVLDYRIRNLVALGKKVVWTGDLNISREQIDTAAADETMRKKNLDSIGWMSSPARRLFNQLLVGGKVYGERDEGRETQIMWDVTRGFHQGRTGMYTCWETKVNARPGNFGARIDYVVCSGDMRNWWSDSNIQEGLMGSDHCPVYASLKDKVDVDGREFHIEDIMNPPGTFINGVRKQEWSTKNLLPMSGRLITEFDGRRNIRDMFSRKPSLSTAKSISELDLSQTVEIEKFVPRDRASAGDGTFVAREAPLRAPQREPLSSPVKLITSKRSANTPGPMPPTKRAKSSTSNSDTNGNRGQQSLIGFFKSKTAPTDVVNGSVAMPVPALPTATERPSASSSKVESAAAQKDKPGDSFPPTSPSVQTNPEDQVATFANKQNWGTLFAKPISPKCEHNEPCKTMLTKKPGVNCGRSFWMCNRPLGPSGRQERDTQWRCSTFIWCSDWDGRASE